MRPSLKRGSRRALTAISIMAIVSAVSLPATAAESKDSQADSSQKITRSLELKSGARANNIPGRWFVELKSPAKAKGGSE
ncbi:Uncharacterised protein [Actinomyces bovis]|uniref:Uncharacterized protein n=1 Tax=Actinomyces bovis TaxID=1658 RepID=A0ABY1VQN5_9ACTO|nr:hypothetical protein [Actinomyces bovis]SPT53712.1 Uncharacterised protein [Actinomyces bovis]VEG55855.1 Uncharacterised protein [Actinomyces israelii]